MAFALTNGILFIDNLNNLNSYHNNNEIKNLENNALNSPITCIKLMSDNTGYGIGSCDGRAHIGYLKSNMNKATKFEE